MDIRSLSLDELAAVDAQFDGLLDASDQVREEQLAALAREHPARAEALGALLRALDAPSEALVPGVLSSATLWRALAASSETDTGSATGLRLGPYRVGPALGRGGMAEVYEAEREDGVFAQRVAIKRLAQRVSDLASVRLFEQERQILADLTHPNIARLLDGGSDEDGRPYLVMELVDGLTIDRFADQARLDVDARLGAFLQAARAVQFAHRRLVVHGDLKPANLLVTREGEVRLLDFGIARLFGNDRPAAAAGSGREQVRLTPAYASPEQWRGEAVTVASDVYQLGLLLFELLTGVRASATPPGSEAESKRVPLASAVVQEGPPEEVEARALARRTSPRLLSRRLRGDLDAIIARAIHPAVAARYGSVDELVEDLERARDHWPVRAAHATRGYRLAKFVRRHRLTVSATAVVLLATFGYAVSSARQAALLARERDREARTSARAEQVAAFLREVFETSAPERALGRPIMARELLDRGARRVDQLTADPALHASLLDVMGRVYSSHGEYEAALPLLERAAEARRALPDVEPRDLADTLQHLGIALYDLDRLDRARQATEEALRLRRSALGPEHADVADSLVQLGRLDFRLDRFDSAMGHFREASAAQPGLVEPLRQMTVVATRQRRFAEAETYARRAYAITAQGAATPDRATAAAALGAVVHNLDRLDEAGALYREAWSVRTAVLGPDHPETLVALNDLAVLEYSRDHYAEAWPLFQRVLEASRRTLPPGHGRLPLFLFNLAGVELQLGKLGEAETHLREALQIRRTLYGEAHWQVVSTAGQLATVLHERGRLAEAESLLSRTIATARAMPSPDKGALSTLLAAHAELLLTAHRLAGAEALANESIALRKAHYGEGHWRVAAAENTLGAIRLAQRHWRDAESLLVPSAAVLEDAVPANRVTARARARLAAFQSARGRTSGAS